MRHSTAMRLSGISALYGFAHAIAALWYWALFDLDPDIGAAHCVTALSFIVGGLFGSLWAVDLCRDES